MDNELNVPAVIEGECPTCKSIVVEHTLVDVHTFLHSVTMVCDNCETIFERQFTIINEVERN